MRNDGTQPGACVTCPARSLLPRHGEGVHPLASCTSERYRLLQCLPRGLIPHAPTSGALRDDARGAGDVLLVHSDNRGHGLFAMVERVANQILFARSRGLRPYVWIGEYVFAEGHACEHGRVPYYDARAGPNVREYFFVLSLIHI